MYRAAILSVIAVLALVPYPEAQERLPSEDALDRARALAAENRYADAFDLLSPHLRTSLTDETSWEIAAEAGRAAFHLGRYREALSILRNVVAARPIVLEPALYLGASSFILGERDQALLILEALLKSEMRDLYLAVTLPGESVFLADPDVQKLLEQYSKVLPVNIDSGSCLGLLLGQPRAEVSAALGATTGEGSLAARAGPHLIWIWNFDDHGILEEVVLHADNLRRYTPYRILIQNTLGVGVTPAAAHDTLGPTDRRIKADDESVILGWTRRRVALDLIFSAGSESQDGQPQLELVRLYRPPG
ncbi:MAG: hypothetical protein K8R59_05440 [Thermoanaerobaculales bacterium]|nr:hypothetical protein [Thermoanaerobaculales bacterium]